MSKSNWIVFIDEDPFRLYLFLSSMGYQFATNAKRILQGEASFSYSCLSYNRHSGRVCACTYRYFETTGSVKPENRYYTVESFIKNQLK